MFRLYVNFASERFFVNGCFAVKDICQAAFIILRVSIARRNALDGLDLAQQIRMTIKHFEQLYQRQRWLGFAVFVA